MILFAFAVPGRFGEWCEAVVGRLAARVLDRVVSVAASSAEQMAADFINAEPADFLVTATEPAPWLHHVLRATGKPFTIAPSDPREAALHLIDRHGLEMADAVRRVASSCAAMMSCVSLPNALVLNAARDWPQPEATVEAVARHFGLAVGLGDIEAIVAEVAALGVAADNDPPEELAVSDRRRIGEIIDGAVSPYVDHFLGAPFGSITWARELMMADGHVPALHAVDVTGRVRALFYGPYISVPPGNWTAEVVLGFSQEAVDINFVVDVLAAGTPLGATSIQPTREGVYSVNLSFAVSEGNTHPLEFRVVNQKAVFDGKLALGRITLTLHHDTPQLGEPLREELGLAQ